jgi:uncharacterized protein (TIGR00369 family)
MTIPYGVHVPFIEHLGMTLERFDNGLAEMHFTARPEHLNTYEVTHGGACMTLLDVVMASASRSLQPELGVVTIEMKTSFMQPAKGLLKATGRVLHRTGRMAFAEGRIEDADGRLCAQASATFKYVTRPSGAQNPPTD